MRRPRSVSGSLTTLGTLDAGSAATAAQLGCSAIQRASVHDPLSDSSSVSAICGLANAKASASVAFCSTPSCGAALALVDGAADALALARAVGAADGSRGFGGSLLPQQPARTRGRKAAEENSLIPQCSLYLGSESPAGSAPWCGCV